MLKDAPHTDRQLYIPIAEIENTDDQELEGSFFSALDHSEYISLKSLLDLSRNSLTKMYFITFSGDKFKRFLATCKTKSIKITGVINMMFILAWRRVYEILNKNDKVGVAKTQRICFSTAVSLRPYLKEVNSDGLSWLATTLYSSFEQETNDLAFDFWKTTFWQLARQNSGSFHSRLQQGEQFNIFDQLKPLHSGESRTHFALSNLIVPKQACECLKLFKIEQFYTTGSARKGREDNFTFHNMISINDSLHWVLSYNSFFIKNETVVLFKESVMDIYDTLCDLE